MTTPPTDNAEETRDGWVLVPREPTEAMLVNGREALMPVCSRETLATYGPVLGIWSDMIAAAPQPDKAGEEAPVAIPPFCYVMSEPHLSGYRVVIGYETQAEAMAAHMAIARAPAQQAVVSEGMVEALKPFAEAADELDDEDHDKNGLWEHPAAMILTAGDLRRAAEVYAALTGDQP